MKRIELDYGHKGFPVDLPDADYCILVPPRSPTPTDTAEVAAQALANPIGSPRLARIVRPGDSVVLAIPDMTRPCPTAKLLPPLLKELEAGGVRDEDILVVSGLGSHRRQTDEERARLAGEDIFARIRCIDFDSSEVTLVGETRRGTPIEVFTPVLQAKRRICVGNIEYHYFAGFSGGYKAIVPGLCSINTIRANHRMMARPYAETGCLDRNPVRTDIDEAGALVGADYILNVILDEDGRAVKAVAGDPITAHRRGCELLDAYGRLEVPWEADIVLVSAGGFPKDINFYQAHKALENAKRAVKPGGTIILVAECSEGIGHSVVAEWLLSGQTPEQLIERIRTGFVLGGHIAAAVALIRQRADIALVSAMPADQVRRMGLQPFSSPSEALSATLSNMRMRARVLVLPLGASVLPHVRGTEVALAKDRFG